MPKAAHKRPSDSNKTGFVSLAANSDHNYGGITLDNLQNGDEEEFPPLPVTPSKPPIPKRPSLSNSRLDNPVISDDAASMLANLINSRSDALEKKVENVHEEIVDIKEKMGYMEKRVVSNEQNITVCLDRVTELERYGRRWNLKLHGVPESDKEICRKEIVRVCQEILPHEKEKIPDFIDVTHRVGKKSSGASSPRAIIIRFTARRYRDDIWKAAKGNSFLQRNGFHFTEDLCKMDRDSRQRLWPAIRKAREGGRSAYFVGGRGFIDGIEITQTTMEE